MPSSPTESDPDARPALRRWLIVPVVVGAVAALVFLPEAQWVAALGVEPSFVTVELAHQLIALGIAAVVLGVAFVLAPAEVRGFFGWGDVGANVEPAPWIGLTPDPGETWRQIGRNFAIIITLVTAVVVFFQVIQGGEWSPTTLFSHLHWVVGFAVVNSFVEESICRLSLVSPLVGLTSHRTIYLLSAAIFGGFHYFGTPGGLPGVALAGFLGWFLAKSVVETRGLFWAWLIHFLQDVVIFAGLFLVVGAGP